MSQPRVLSGIFKFRVDRPPVPSGPVFQNVGIYTLFPDALMHISFNGDVLLPPGRWEVGIVQNCWNDRVTNVYSEGGEFYFSQDSKPLLDVPSTASDIWLDTLGNGVAVLENSSAADKTFHVSLEAGDTPTSPPIAGTMARCGGQITEHLMFAERVLQLVAALVARKDGQVFPIAATAGNTYGFMWRLEPAPGAPTFRFKPFFPSAVELTPPFGLFHPGGVATTPPTANQVGITLAANAAAAYLADCGRRVPRRGDEDLWNT